MSPASPSALDPQAAPTPIVAPRYGPRDYAVRRLLAGADVVSVAAGLLIMGVASSPPQMPRQLALALLTLPVWVVLFKAYGLYDRDIKRINHTTLDDLPWLLHAVLVGCLLLWFYFRIVPTGGVRFANILIFAGTVVVIDAALRTMVRRITARVVGPERVLLIGAGRTISLLIRKMRAHPEYGLDPIGCIIEDNQQQTPDRLDDPAPAELPVMGHMGDPDLARVLALHRVERLVISPAQFEDKALLDLLQRCRALSVKVSLLPQLFDALGPSVEIDDVEGITVLGINPPVLSPSTRLMKRSMDIAGALSMLLISAPTLLLIALAVKLTSRGPVLFRQVRVGREGRRFKLLKFRTMVVGAESRYDELLTQSLDPHWLQLADDPRVTQLGRLLRVASLDELPQFLNVLRGEMSLVGPRPLTEGDHRQLTGWARSRLDLTPGLTGLWQVLGRTNIPFEEMIKLDYLYITNWSLWTDVRLIMRTLPVVLSRRGAN